MESLPRRTMRRCTQDDSRRVDHGQNDADAGEPAVGMTASRQQGATGDEISDQEEADLERIAAEDVAHGELPLFTGQPLPSCG